MLRAQILKFIDELVKPDCLEKLTLEKFAEPFYGKITQNNIYLINKRYYNKKKH